MFRIARKTRVSIIPQQPLDIIELELRAEALAEAAAQLLDDAAGALHVDFAPDPYGGVVGGVAPAPQPGERVGLLLGALPSEPAWLAGTLAHHALLLHG